MAYMSRVTLDLDGKRPNFEIEAAKAWYALKREADEVRFTISSGGGGLHMEGFFDEPLTAQQKMDLRVLLGDDIARITMDKERIRHGLVNNVLWTKKGRHDGAEIDDDFDDLWDAIDHIQATTRTDYDRIHDLANNGRRALREHREFNRYPG